MNNETDDITELEFLRDLRSILGNGPCMAVGCPGCACEMQMASDEITARLLALGADDEWLKDGKPWARCSHVGAARTRGVDGGSVGNAHEESEPSRS